MLHHLSSLSGHHKESGSLEPSRGQSQQFSCYKAVFSFFLWQHYHGILAWGEWTYSDRCLDLKRENDHKYTHHTQEAVTTVTTRCHRGVEWEGLTWVCCGQHPLRFLCSPCFFSWAECRAGWWTALHLWVLFWYFHLEHLTWHDEQDRDQPRHGGEHHGGEAVVGSLHKDFCETNSLVCSVCFVSKLLALTFRCLISERCTLLLIGQDLDGLEQPERLREAAVFVAFWVVQIRWLLLLDIGDVALTALTRHTPPPPLDLSTLLSPAAWLDLKMLHVITHNQSVVRQSEFRLDPQVILNFQAVSMQIKSLDC